MRPGTTLGLLNSEFSSGVSIFALLVAILAAHLGSAMTGSTMSEAAAAMAPPPAPPPSPLRRRVASGLSPAISLFSRDDHPTQALRRQEEGLVLAEVDVTPDGRVGECRVVQSSDSLSLDETTCAIMKRRARYRPARDDAGQAVVGHDKIRVKWLMPREPYRAVTDLLEVRYKADGRLGECRYHASDTGPPPCRLIGEMVERVRAATGDNRPLDGRWLFIEHKVELDGKTWVGANRQDRLVTLWQQVAEYRLRPDGRLTECRMIAGKSVEGGTDLCQQPFDGPYEFDNTGAFRPLRTTLSLLSAQ